MEYGNYQPPRVVAEIGCNHKGDFEIAKELVLMAKICGANVAKFQKRDNKLLLPSSQYNASHPVPQNSYGKTYGEHREFLEFSIQQHAELKNYCESIDIGYSTSVWDVNSARQIVEINPTFLKVPSACNTNFDLLEVLRDDYDGEIQISLGMTTRDEEEKLVNFFTERNQAKERLTLYACTSGYPVEFKDCCLLEIVRLKESYGSQVKTIGFSGHHLGIAIDVAAYTLGAVWIERHFTKDRTWKGTDHAASLEPDGLRRLCRDLKASFDSLKAKPNEILPVEEVQRTKLKYGRFE